MTVEVGKPLTEAYGELANVSSAIRYFAEMARDESGKIAGTTQANSMQMEIKEPMGISAHILPFNFPILIMMWTVSASLAAGNAVIIKPSEQASLTSLVFMKFFNNLPAGVVACVTGDSSTGQLIIGHKDSEINSIFKSIDIGLYYDKYSKEVAVSSIVKIYDVIINDLNFAATHCWKRNESRGNYVHLQNIY